MLVQNFVTLLTLSSLLFVSASQDIGVTSVNDAENGAVEEFTTSCSQGSVVASVVMDLGLGKHRHVFDFRLSQVGAVRGNKDHLSLTPAKSLQGMLVAQDGLARFHHQLKATVHGVL